MEIEAKFLVNDNDTFRALSNVDVIAGFRLSSPVNKLLKDTYYDTADRAIYKSGNSFRRRIKGDKFIYTLKELGSSEDSIHRRSETEIVLDEDIPFGQWDEGPMKEMLISIIGSASPEWLFDVNHERIDRNLMDEERKVAQLSLDDVHVICDGKDAHYLEAEIELSSGGLEKELLRMVQALEDEYELRPGNLSKFETGLQVLDGE